jgi:hypothetical protein
MIKYAYKTEITKFGELKVHIPTLDFTNFTKFDAAKQSARDIAKASLLSHLQFYINQRREIPTTDDYPFVAERIELDWQTNIRVRLSNWFIKNSRLKSVDEIDEEYSERSQMEICRGSLSTEKIQHLFLLDKELNMVDVMELTYAFYIDVVFHEVKLEFKDND